MRACALASKRRGGTRRRLHGDILLVPRSSLFLLASAARRYPPPLTFWPPTALARLEYILLKLVERTFRRPCRPYLLSVYIFLIPPFSHLYSEILRSILTLQILLNIETEEIIRFSELDLSRERLPTLRFECRRWR